MAEPGTVTLQLRGAVVGAATEPATTSAVRITAARRVRPGPASASTSTSASASTRDDAGTGPTVTLAADELVRVEYTNGIRLWTRADDLLRDRARPVVERSSAGRAQPVWELDLAPRAAAHGSGATTRGLAGIGIRVLECFGVEVAKEAAGAAAAAFEQRRLELPAGQAPGLYRTRLQAGAALEPVTGGLPSGEPLLVFLHGTMSSFRGSFGSLEADGAGDDARAARETRLALQHAYGSHLYAFEHLTLTHSPIRNALDLVAALPVDAELHLVSHSRGGLVGELLCLAERDRTHDPLATGWLDMLFADDRTVFDALGPQTGLPASSAAQQAGRAAARAADRAALRELLDALDAKRPTVRRFVRVACPARGTTLASGRLDRWLSVLDVMAGYTLFGDAADFLLAVIRQRTDPRTMPGIEAMLPGSALTRLLQLPTLATSADLSVIAGDVEGDSLWGQLKLLVADWFYGAEHDLVVNTGSMSGGLRRQAPGAARAVEVRGPLVNHFRYFSNAASLRWLQAGLLRTDASDGGYGPIDAARAEAPRWRAAVQRSQQAAVPRPIVLVVPGTMGSALDAGGRRIWLDPLALLRGGLADIGWNAAGVEPAGLLSDIYGPLLEHLAREHRVELFPYDWRRSVHDSAAALQSVLQPLLAAAEATQRPLHLVAHSLGGLVCRAMIADGAAGAALWQRMGRLPGGSRLLMLGTPHRGSHEAMRWLTGYNPTQAKLALLDLRHGVDGIIDIVRRYPGMAELLPFGTDPEAGSADDRALARVDTWRSLKRESNAGFPLVEQSVLDAAALIAQRLLQAAPDPARMHGVVGSQPETIVGWRVPPDDGIPGPRRLEWIATAEGDGTVSWASARLEGVSMHLAVDTAHDALCANADDRRLFRGYVDLLGSGRTDQLPSLAPPGRRGADSRPATFVLPLRPLADCIPDAAAMQAATFSGRDPRRVDGAAVTAPLIRVGVRHGDLSYARHAVLVGHYEGDTIVSAEAAVDRRLAHALTRRRDLGLYPGERGTHAVFCNPDPSRAPSAAVVVGLGAVGELATGQLQASVRDAMLEYALRLAQTAAVAAAGAAAGPHPARVACRLSCLLVGSGGAGLSIRESVESILRAALDANRRLTHSHLDSKVLFAEIEFIELYEDIAIGAARAVAHAMAADDIGDGVEWLPPIMATGPGARQRRYYDNDRSWDQRIEIALDRGAGILRFNVATNRARSEDTLSTGQVALADLFVAQAGAGTMSNEALSKTLFELLLPPSFKETAPDQRDMVLVVDEHSARFPWELLQDKRSRNDEPIAIESGVVRQLKTADFRLRPSQAMGDNALVVGNPDLGASSRFADLPGARDEAQLVGEVLRRRYAAEDVQTLVGAPAAAIVAALHSRAWRVLHLAGHGEHDWRSGPDARPLSGMVIGDGVFLTPGDVEQMRCVPELVFINCCHLGKTEAEPRVVPFPRLAANLGAQFIRMGVRAVVCAGWAVDDDAAATFASVFYDELLGGSAFRDAVKAARRDTLERHPQVNTWGAYQCYGDPSWRLDRNGRPASSAERSDYVAVHEFVTDLCNLAEGTRVQMQQDHPAPDALRARLESEIEGHKQRVPAAVREAWLARADVAAALGFAYSEALMLEPAIAALEQALSASAGDCPVRAAEQSARFRVRLAMADAAHLREQPPARAAGQRPDHHAVAARLAAAIAGLDAVNRRAATAERSRLLGSACQWLARLRTRRAARAAALLQAAGHHRDALEAAADDDVRDFVHWALACLLVERLEPRHGRGNWHAELERLSLRQAERAAVGPDAAPGGAGTAALGALALVQLLLAADDRAAVQRHAADAAAQVRAAGGRDTDTDTDTDTNTDIDIDIDSDSDSDGLRKTLEFLIEMTRLPPDDTAGARLRSALWPEPVTRALADLRSQF